VKRTLIFILAGAVAVVGLVFAARYARETGERLHDPLNPAGPALTIRLARNPAPISPFTARDIDDRPVDTATWKGRVTLLNFWATWCPPCRAEIPDLVGLQKKYGDRLQIVGIADDLSPDVVRQFIGNFGVNYPNVMMLEHLRSRFRISALPTTYVVDTEGRVVQRHVGQINPPVIEQEIRSLLGLSVSATIEKFDDVGQISLGNAAQATDIPGLDLASLPAERRTKAILQLNTDTCTCGCGLTLAQCRIDDPTCTVSLPLAQKVVENWK
jgi:cytochrome c biogenesis protein CcmG/thiol:disulfide interchange protein DsbE